MAKELDIGVPFWRVVEPSGLAGEWEFVRLVAEWEVGPVSLASEEWDVTCWRVLFQSYFYLLNDCACQIIPSLRPFWKRSTVRVVLCAFWAVKVRPSLSVCLIITLLSVELLLCAGTEWVSANCDWSETVDLSYKLRAFLFRVLISGLLLWWPGF